MQTALITGASGDIGKAIALKLSGKYKRIILHYHNNYETIVKVKDELERRGNDVIIVQADFSHKQGVNHFLKQYDGAVDLIVHNSGSSYFRLITDWDDQDAEDFIRLHVTSPFLLTKKLLPHMITKKQGTIIVVTSIWGITGAACEVLYSMVKGGQNTFVKALAKEVAPSGIKVNGIAPGAIDTKMLNEFTEAEKTALKEEIPEGKLGNPNEVANLVSYLASEQSNYINGQIISINGAWHC
jgi:3-oxoacyl-[acyl-carrier protein] reductase